MTITRTAVTAMAGLAVIAAAGCGAVAAQGTPTASPAAATPIPHLTWTQQGEACAGLDMVRLGYSTYMDQVRAVAGQYQVSQATAEQVIAWLVDASGAPLDYSATNRCPAEVSVIPPGAPG